MVVLLYSFALLLLPWMLLYCSCNNYWVSCMFIARSPALVSVLLSHFVCVMREKTEPKNSTICVKYICIIKLTSALEKYCKTNPFTAIKNSEMQVCHLQYSPECAWCRTSAFGSSSLLNFSVFISLLLQVCWHHTTSLLSLLKVTSRQQHSDSHFKSKFQSRKIKHTVVQTKNQIHSNTLSQVQSFSIDDWSFSSP